MKPSLVRLPAFVALLGAALFAASTTAQAPEQPQGAPAAGPPAQGHGHMPAPKPTNLKVLPKDLTGEQVHEIMHKWEADLGAECTTCHAVDPSRKMPNGRPALNFPDDSKPEKSSARLMFAMMQDVNKNYVAKIPKSGHDDDGDAMVTCGTCHRGHLHPEAFVAPKEHEHGAPGAAEHQAPSPH